MARGSLNLRIRKFEFGDHKSYAQLAERSFSPYDFDRLRLLPEDAHTDTNEKPVLLVQLNLIPGGLILALGFNHVATDGCGRSLATTLICRCSKSVMEASSVPRSDFDYRRDSFAGHPEPLALPREELINRIEDYQIIETAPTTSGTQPPQMNSIMSVGKGLIYRIEGSAVQRLKDSCKPLNGVTYISTYDCCRWNALEKRSAHSSKIETTHEKL